MQVEINGTRDGMGWDGTGQEMVNPENINILAVVVTGKMPICILHLKFVYAIFLFP